MPRMLDRVGFCGVDDSVNLDDLVSLSEANPWIEWGVLLRSDKQGSPRYASSELLDRLRHLVRVNGSGNGRDRKDSMTEKAERLQSRSRSPHSRDQVRSSGVLLAAHLCGEDCLRALRGDIAHVKSLHRQIGFQRLQINPTRANAAGGWEAGSAAKCLREVAAAIPDVELILQVNEETNELMQRLFKDPQCKPPMNFAALFDPSCGLGVLPKSRQAPFDGIHCGYAGGIGPDTVVAQLQEVAAACAGHTGTVWIDMESGIRSTDATTGNDIFDLARVRRVVEQVVAADVIA
mmetsp:Transcript_25296/g.39978  ORF Transcript_25296/g.39978 Transcript_25296/m.39978 type:complete len:291 (-) Transcript_25296:69-941(-)